jgi:hypothetical protein
MAMAGLDEVQQVVADAALLAPVSGSSSSLSALNARRSNLAPRHPMGSKLNVVFHSAP